MKPLKVPGSIFLALPCSNDLATIARLQGVSPIDEVDDLLGDFWPKDESPDDFVETIRRWWREGGYA